MKNESIEFIQGKSAGLSLIASSKKFTDHILRYDFESIIDFGCGFGTHVSEFARAGKKATGVDIKFDFEALNQAKEMGYDLVEGSWEAIADSYYDVAFSHHCLEHATDPISWLNTWAKKTKPGGKLFLVVPSFKEKPILAGHITTGWNTYQLAYNLAVAGWDCRNGKFEEVEGNVYAIVDRPEEVLLHDTHVISFGSVLEFMPSTLSLSKCTNCLTGPLDKIFEK